MNNRHIIIIQMCLEAYAECKEKGYKDKGAFIDLALYNGQSYKITEKEIELILKQPLKDLLEIPND